MNETIQDVDLLQRLESAYGRTFDVSQVADRVALRPSLRRLVRAGYLANVGRGVYTILERPHAPTLVDDDELRLATAALGDTPHYVSWRAALSRHNLTEQDPKTIAVALRVRRTSRSVGDLKVRPVYQSTDRFYGFRTVRVPSGGSIRLATPEKAILDSLDRPDLGGGLPEVVKALGRTSSYDAKDLVGLARRYPSQATVARLGFLMTVFGIGDPSPLQNQVRRKGPPVTLDLLESEAGASLDSTWRVSDNVGVDTLRAWADR